MFLAAGLRMASAIPYHPFDPAVRADPYPFYARLREEAPLFDVPGLGVVAASRHRDVRAVLEDPHAFSSCAMRDLIQRAATQSSGELSGETLLGTDPPAHTRLRKIVNRGFIPRRIAALEPRIRAIARELLAGLAERDAWDFVAEFAVPLPVRVIAEVLGVEPERHRDFKRWSDDYAAAAGGAAATPEQLASLRRSREELNAWIDPMLEDRRARPRDDLISALVGAEGSDEVMTAREVGNLVVILLIAGNETTTNLLGSAMLALLEAPDQLALLRERPALVPGLVEEALRYDSPVQMVFRRATADAKLPSGEIRAGQVVGALIGAANRDPDAFRAPERFEVRRDASRHLAFGFGTHFCLGAPLARLEARVAFETLLPHLRGCRRREPEIEYTPSLLLRGPRRLRIALERAG
jgi:cytochrome P450